MTTPHADRDPRTCELAGCDRKHYSHGLCKMHRYRQIRTGDAGPAHVIKPPALPTCAAPDCAQRLSKRLVGDLCRKHFDEDRLWSRIQVTGSCWLWLGHRCPGGYGRLAANGRKSVRAHRHVYELLVGPIPDGLVLDHLCRIRTCVNPDHLDPVTPGENTLRANAHSIHDTSRRAA